MFQTEFIIEEFEFVLAEEYKFEKGAKKEEVAVLGNSELFSQCFKKYKSTLPRANSFLQLHIFRCLPDRKDKACNSGEI